MRIALFRFGVRTFLLMIAAFALALAWDLRRSREIGICDLIEVDVRSALPGRPIAGERLVRPDGCITLGYYGDVQVTGLTNREARARIIGHLKNYLPAESLGLVDSRVGGRGKQQALPDHWAVDTDPVTVRILTKNATSGFIGWVMRDVCHYWAFGQD